MLRGIYRTCGMKWVLRLLACILCLTLFSCDNGSVSNSGVNKNAELANGKTSGSSLYDKAFLKGLSAPEVFKIFIDYWSEGLKTEMLRCMKPDSEAYAKFSAMPVMTSFRGDARITKTVIYGNVAKIHAESKGPPPSMIEVRLVKNATYWEITEVSRR